MTQPDADDVRVDQALSLLWHAARISPPLREAVDIVEGAIDRFRLGPPEGWVEIDGDSVMSNFDHEVDRDQEARLREGGCWGRYAGWEFNARVWFMEGGFVAQVWRYGTPIANYFAATLEALMQEISDEWGWE